MALASRDGYAARETISSKSKDLSLDARIFQALKNLAVLSGLNATTMAGELLEPLVVSIDTASKALRAAMIYTG
jgi:hypothetical protein